MTIAVDLIGLWPRIYDGDRQVDGAPSPDRPSFANARELPSKVTMTRGDVIRHEQSGGGGYRDPLLCAPERVSRDVANGKISAAFARDRHGLVIAAASAIPDMEATLLLRAAMRRAAHREPPPACCVSPGD